MSTTFETSRPYDPRSVSPLSFWSSSALERDETYKVLRDERPVSWHPPAEGSLMPPENEGFWAVTRHEDIVEVSTHPELFKSGAGTMFEEVPADFLVVSSSFLALDGEEHQALRKLFSSAFTPKQIKKIDLQIQAQAAKIVDDLLEVGDCDFVKQVSMRLPMWSIYEMLGLPLELREEAAHHADGMVAWADEEVAAGRTQSEVLNESLAGLLRIGTEFSADTRKHPRDPSDIWTNLINAEVDGRRLTDSDLASFFSLLSVAGNDTTRNTITLTAKALADFPEQKALLLEDYDGRINNAIEEFVRWATPVMTFRRTATQDTVIGGQQIREGEWLVMFYASGNRDERVFEDPWKFDILRKPNPHVAFGGGGPHYCLGNFLAKTQLKHLFRELLHRAPNLEFGEPKFLVGNFVNAVKTMPCTLR